MGKKKAYKQEDEAAVFCIIILTVILSIAWGYFK